MISRIHNVANVYVTGVLTQDGKCRELRGLINSYGSIFVVGAGLSFESGVPLTKHPEHILKFCNSSNYDELISDAKKCHKFKNEFAKMCNEKEFGKSHTLIVENFPNRIKEIICLNWDNLIERSARNLKKVIVKVNEDNVVPTSVGHLWKFHGDVEKITQSNVRGSGGWVFPNEGGFVFNSFKTYINEENGLNKSLFTLVIVGYSEGDQEINSIIKTFEALPPRPTFRISLAGLEHLDDPTYIVGPSEFILQWVLDQYE